MVTRRDEKRKGTWCASSARNRDTLNMIVLSTRVKPRGGKRCDDIATWSESKDESSKEENEKKSGKYVLHGNR